MRAAMIQQRVDFVGDHPEAMPAEHGCQSLQLLAAVCQAVGIAGIIQDHQFLAVCLALASDKAFEDVRLYTPTPLEVRWNADDLVTCEAGLRRIRHPGRSRNVYFRRLKGAHDVVQQRLGARRNENLARLDRIAIRLMMKSGDSFAQRRQPGDICVILAIGGAAQSFLHPARRRKGRFAEAKAIHHAPGIG